MTNLEKMVKHFNYKWPDDNTDVLYHWYGSMYSSKPPPKMPYSSSYSRNDFESYVERNCHKN